MVKKWRSKTIDSSFRRSIRKTNVYFQSLNVDSRFEQTYEDDIAALILKSVQLDDAGEYICRASNDEGSDTSSAQLTVKGN